MFSYSKFFHKKNNFIKKNKESAPAKLIDKKISFSKNESYYSLIFELYTGSKLSFKVDSYIYSQYCSGDKGILTYSVDKFINFKKKY